MPDSLNIVKATVQVANPKQKALVRGSGLGNELVSINRSPKSVRLSSVVAERFEKSKLIKIHIDGFEEARFKPIAPPDDDRLRSARERFDAERRAEEKRLGDERRKFEEEKRRFEEDRARAEAERQAKVEAEPQQQAKSEQEASKKPSKSK